MIEIVVTAEDGHSTKFTKYVFNIYHPVILTSLNKTEINVKKKEDKQSIKTI